MESRRSYLDSVNEGRQRKPSASLEHLSRSLEQLEQQLSLRQRAQQVVRAQAQGAYADERPAPHYTEQRDAAWGKSDPYENVERVTREFQTLRAEMLNSNLARQDHIREQVGSDLRREFNALRRELEQSYESANAQTGAKLDAEIARLTKAIQHSKDKSDDKAVNLLRLEIEQIKNSVAGLAREDSVLAVTARWDEFERNMGQSGFDQAIEALSTRLEQISDAIGTLPEQISVDRVDSKLRNLAEVIERFVQQESERNQPQAINAIESRLEEISRSIVAISMADQKNAFDPSLIEKLDSRIVALARQIEDGAGQTDDVIVQRLDVISDRIEKLVAAGSMTAATDEMTKELNNISKKLAAAAFPTGIDKSIEQLEQRLVNISKQIETQAASDDAILGLQQRLDALTDKLDANQSEPLDPALIRALEAQLSALSAHLDQPNPTIAEVVELAPRLERIEAAVSGSKDGLIETARLAAEEVLRNFAGSPIEAAAIAGLTDDLKSLEGLTRDADDRNTRTFDAIHETLIKIIDRIGQLDVSEQYVVSNDAPLAIAEAVVEEEQEEAPKLDVGQAPSIDMDEVPPIDEDSASFEFNFEAAPVPGQVAEADTDEEVTAIAEVESVVEDAPAPAPAKVSGWKRIFRKKEKTEAPAATSEPTLEMQAEDLDANRPLEPGSAAPDLNAIIRRVRENRDDLGTEVESDTSRSDFIAAARRAAQAAAAEAELLKKDENGEKPGRKSVLASILKGRRRPILLAVAAIMAALAGLQLGKAFVKDPVEIAGGNTGPVAEIAATMTPVSAPKMEVAAPAVKSETVKAAADDGDSGPDTTLTTASVTPASPDDRVAAASAPVTAAAATSTEIPAQVGPLALREAAQNGDAKALYVIGSRLAEGAGLASNMQQASGWFEKSAELGYAPAQFRIGNLYEKGLGVTRDFDKARSWYQLSANQGNANAMHNLAVLYATGADKAPDNEAAVRWFTKAAAFGVKDSQYNLGILAAKGAGMPLDMEQAYKWFGLVANTGDRDASDKRDEVAKAMSPDQLNQAKQEIAAWKAQPQDPAANEVEIPDAWQEAPSSTAKVDMDKAIRNVQALLNKAGYDVGMADGMIGNKTRQAIAAFQEDHGMQPTGRIDESMVKALLAKN
ncbi:MULTISPECIES: peptidoglycan-binding protein [Mesorhizobium]|uniref:Peptidoglycan-binding protein n=1 Tax=Mesorhizobium denitrificans TaxID=2294114 RepID=A0A371XD46_9HYPH|nr:MULTISPECIES: peptidoglycan-binding protein [Mesorhizobium]RFC67136.1 peptidoglycan-binding protein [Mesorhizobium denitrificans]